MRTDSLGIAAVSLLVIPGESQVFREWPLPARLLRGRRPDRPIRRPDTRAAQGGAGEALGAAAGNPSDANPLAGAR